jgi:putative oxidoreductase
MKFLFKTNDSFAPTLARLTLGLVMFPHGAQKVLGLFGGYGFHGTMNFFTQQMHIPAVFAVLAIAAEFLGSLGLITGFLSRIAAFGIAVNMIVAVKMVHATNGFFMNWYGNQKGEGFEYHVLAIGLAVIVLIYGAGNLSVDAALAKKSPKPARA